MENTHLLQNKDIFRNVYSILGIPIDAISTENAIQIIHQSITDGRKCFISTPNLNFLLLSRSSEIFYESIQASNLVLADGMSVLCIARLLGIPVIHKVSGSDVFEHLVNSKRNSSIKVFFLGGDGNSSEKAMEYVNKVGLNISCVGQLNPGYGTVKELSTEQIIDSINYSDADFLVVSLGAKKGQEWILNNINSLDAVVISNLGAVVNFMAGTVKRAPLFMQSTGLEWVWRIKEEPYLFRRYMSDGLAFIKLAFTTLTPYIICKLYLRMNKLFSRSSPDSVSFSDDPSLIITINGSANIDSTHKIRNYLILNSAQRFASITYDLSNIQEIDEYFIGHILLMTNLYGITRIHISNANKIIKHIICFNQLQNVLTK